MDRSYSMQRRHAVSRPQQMLLPQCRAAAWGVLEFPCVIWHFREQAHVHGQPYERRVSDAFRGCLLTARHTLYGFLPESSSLLGTKINGLQLEPAHAQRAMCGSCCG